MHSLPRAARPQDNSTPYNQRRPDKWNTCPQCGKPKTKTGKLCRQCRYPRPKLFMDDRQNGVDYDQCPNCNGPKKVRTPICQSCKANRPPERPEIIMIDNHYCRYLPLTQGLYAIVDADLYDTLTQWKWTVRRTGSYSDGRELIYAYRKDGKKGIQMHQFVARLLSHEAVMDHADRNGLDNRVSNLRPATQTQNRANSAPRANKTGFKGVYLDKRRNKFRARIQAYKVPIDLGYFDTAQEAAIAVDRALVENFGEFAILNFPHKRQ